MEVELCWRRTARFGGSAVTERDRDGPAQSVTRTL